MAIGTCLGVDRHNRTIGSWASLRARGRLDDRRFCAHCGCGSMGGLHQRSEWNLTPCWEAQKAFIDVVEELSPEARVTRESRDRNLGDITLPDPIGCT
jgi:hypothetical protein